VGPLCYQTKYNTTMKKHNKIKVFFNPKQVNTVVGQSFSKSPLKPKLVIENIFKLELDNHFDFEPNFQPFRKADFKIAHTRNYVDAVFSGKGHLASSNSIPWSENLAESVTYTNASLYNAIKYAVENPQTVTFSPTSGFHHAQPSRGCGFCTFSGQVIASVKLWREKGLRGAYLDLDGHFGNSIEDSRDYVKDLNEAIPRGFNINPQGYNERYLNDLHLKLIQLEKAIEAGYIDYIVWCHGADSHADDDLGCQCSTHHWLACSKAFYGWLNYLQAKLGRQIPVTMALFGGYRADDYQSVLNLHLMDLGLCLDMLTGTELNLNLEVKKKAPKYPVVQERKWTRREIKAWERMKDRHGL
jgi:acetoin utilization deacetylase AcuC-like enzyme